MQNPIKLKLKIALLILPVFCAACANKTELIFISEPMGASLSELRTGTYIGSTPITIQYDLDEVADIDGEGCYVLSGVRALWSSGATEQMSQLRLCDIHRHGYTVNLVRPESYPNLEEDIVIAKELQYSSSYRRRSIGASSNNPYGHWPHGYQNHPFYNTRPNAR